MSDSDKNAERRKRYHSDPVYRARIIENVKTYKKKKSERLKLERERSKYNKKYWISLKVNKKIVECCKLSLLSSSLGRSNITIREWENSGKFPKTFKHKNRRYYTKRHYQMIVREWERKKDLNSFFQKVNANWSKLY